MDDWTPPGWDAISGEPSPTSGWTFVNLYCRAEGCGYRDYTGMPLGVTVDDLLERRSAKDHQDQHRPDRALDIAVDWEVVAYCSVCEDGFGDVVQADEGVECRICGTYWSIDGTGGYRYYDM